MSRPASDEGISCPLKRLCTTEPSALTRGLTLEQLRHYEPLVRRVADHMKAVLATPDTHDTDMPHTVSTDERTLKLAADEHGKLVVKQEFEEGIAIDLRAYPNRLRRITLYGLLGNLPVTFELEQYYCQAPEEWSFSRWRLLETRSGEVLLPQGSDFSSIDLSFPKRPSVPAAYSSGADGAAHRSELQPKVRASLESLRERCGCSTGDSRSLDEWTATLLAAFHKATGRNRDDSEVGMLNFLFCELGISDVEQWGLELD